MRIIDLSFPIYNGMPVFPGDPEVEIKQIHNLSKQGWNLSTLSISTHIATHVNVPLHMVRNGKTLDDFKLDLFMGEAELYRPKMKFNKEKGVIFHSCNVSQEIASDLIKTSPKFIGLSSEFEFDINLERFLLEHGVISFENLANTSKLPSSFYFYGIPLKIKNGDGSPVRAFAVVEQ